MYNKLSKEERNYYQGFTITNPTVRKKLRFQFRAALTQEEQALKDFNGHWFPGSMYLPGTGYVSPKQHAIATGHQFAFYSASLSCRKRMSL